MTLVWTHKHTQRKHNRCAKENTERVKDRNMNLFLNSFHFLYHFNTQWEYTPISFLNSPHKLLDPTNQYQGLWLPTYLLIASFSIFFYWFYLPRSFDTCLSIPIRPEFTDLSSGGYRGTTCVHIPEGTIVHIKTFILGIFSKTVQTVKFSRFLHPHLGKTEMKTNIPQHWLSTQLLLPELPALSL